MSNSSPFDPSRSPKGFLARSGELITPDAVVIDLPLADVGSRTLALILDLFVMIAMFQVIGLIALFGAFSTVDSITGWYFSAILLYLNVVLVFWGYPVLCETFFRGRTLGKKAFGLRVTTMYGSPIRFRHAAIRATLALFELYIMLGTAALFTAMSNPNGQRLGDLAAGTVVIRDRTRASSTPLLLQTPPGYETYAATLDVSNLTANEYAAIRSMLLRGNQIRPTDREPTAFRLATFISHRMAHQIPPTVPPVYFLRCVGAVLQNRQLRYMTALGPATYTSQRTRQPVPGRPVTAHRTEPRFDSSGGSTSPTLASTSGSNGPFG